MKIRLISPLPPSHHDHNIDAFLYKLLDPLLDWYFGALFYVSPYNLLEKMYFILEVFLDAFPWNLLAEKLYHVLEPIFT